MELQASEQDGSLDATDDAYMPEDVRSNEFRLIKFYAIQNTAETQAQGESVYSLIYNRSTFSARGSTLLAEDSESCRRISLVSDPSGKTAL